MWDMGGWKGKNLISELRSQLFWSSSTHCFVVCVCGGGGALEWPPSQQAPPLLSTYDTISPLSPLTQRAECLGLSVLIFVLRWVRERTLKKAKKQATLAKCQVA